MAGSQHWGAGDRLWLDQALRRPGSWLQRLGLGMREVPGSLWPCLLPVMLRDFGGVLPHSGPLMKPGKWPQRGRNGLWA